MKNSILFFCFLLGAICFAQDITNTLPPGGKFIVKDASNNYLTLDQATGQMNVIKNLRLENTTSSSLGVIFKGANRFIHNSGTDNTFIGINSGNFTMSGYDNTALGIGSLFSNTSGNYNTANGFNALYLNTTGYSNTAIGTIALYSNTTGYDNTANGLRALYSNTTGYENTANGSNALMLNTTGVYNTSFGYQSLYNNTEGDVNTANGHKSLYSNTTGGGNTAIGGSTLRSNTTGNDNTAIGFVALYYNTTGKENTANGYQSLYYNTIGFSNTANGCGALLFNTTGGNNTAIGSFALHHNSTQSENTAVGNSAGDNYTFSQGIFLGSYAYPNADSYSNIMGLGYNSRPTASNQVRIGNSAVTSIGGYAGWTNLSDARYKTSVQENVRGLDFILKLRPITYKLDVNKLAADLGEDRRRDENGNIKIGTLTEDIKARNEKSQIVYTGFIAQEVEKVAKEIGFDFSGIDSPKNENDFYGLRYAEFVVPLVKAVQEQQSQIHNQEKIIEELTRRIEQLERK